MSSYSFSSRFECCPVKIIQLHRRHGGFKPLVAELHTGTVDSLVDCIGGDDAENDRQSTLEACLGDTARDLVRNIVEVWGLTTNNRTQTDDCIKLARLREAQCEQWN